LAEPIKEKHGGEQAAQAQSGPAEGAERMSARARREGKPAQTDGAKDAVVVLGDALATEELAALRALGGSFAGGMVEAMLLGERQHGG